MNRPMPEKSMISSSLASTSAFLIPRIVPLRKMFSRPVSSGWNPVPTSSKLATRPASSIRPEVGEVMRARILSSVLFPAPFLPMTPMTSPCSTLKLTSRRAHTMSAVSSPLKWAKPAESFEVTERLSDRREDCPGKRVLSGLGCADAVALREIVHADCGSSHGCYSDDVGEDPLGSTEVVGAGDDEQCGRRSPWEDKVPRHWVGSEERRAEALNNPGHRV